MGCELPFVRGQPETGSPASPSVSTRSAKPTSAPGSQQTTNHNRPPTTFKIDLEHGVEVRLKSTSLHRDVPDGRLPKWPTGADCKSAGLRLRWFESITYHHSINTRKTVVLANNFRRFVNSVGFQFVRFPALGDFCRLAPNDAQKSYRSRTSPVCPKSAGGPNPLPGVVQTRLRGQMRAKLGHCRSTRPEKYLRLRQRVMLTPAGDGVTKFSADKESLFHAQTVPTGPTGGGDSRGVV